MRVIKYPAAVIVLHAAKAKSPALLNSYRFGSNTEAVRVGRGKYKPNRKKNDLQEQMAGAQHLNMQFQLDVSDIKIK